MAAVKKIGALLSLLAMHGLEFIADAAFRQSPKASLKQGVGLPQEELWTKLLLFFIKVLHQLGQAKLLAMLQVLRRLVQLPDQRFLPHVPVLAL
ncbi:uncharacterized protein Triagg1_10566 [Trichoderma aggressivum f. europaeum]|uniref:Uncharacterized protein n=1 Tax=Trichoderma aggressivum f. europaeum TaxID=173218 RepID=A0AAE1I5L5_9HYPO|nr:hypothetical protein Triagg1_10566 [Trichoderma aggressivum f. europaeum]